MTGRFDLVTVCVVAALFCVLAMAASCRVARPRHDPWQPQELSVQEQEKCGLCGRPVAEHESLDLANGLRVVGCPHALGKRLGPPFSSTPGNGVRKA